MKIPLAIKTISVLNTKENTIIKKHNIPAIQKVQNSWQDAPGLFAPLGSPPHALTLRPEAAIRQMMASPRSQPCTDEFQAGPSQLLSVAMGLLWGTVSACTCAGPQGPKEDGSCPVRRAVRLE